MAGRTNVYIDGFNFYYGAVKRRPELKWLNVESYYSSQLLAGQTLNRIRYFTAPVKPLPHDSEQPARQAAYLSALETLDRVSIHKGQFKQRVSRLPRADRDEKVRVIRSEEKGSDVNLATHLLLDAFGKDMEVAVVVTDDFDQLEPLRRVRADLGIQTGILSPRGRPALSQAVGASFYRPVKVEDLSRHQLPATVQGAKGPIHRPRSWS